MRLLIGHKWAVRAVAYAPHDPTLLATGSDDRTVRLWDLRTGEAQALTHAGTGPVLALAFAPDGGRLAVGGGRIVVWNVDLARVVAEAEPAPGVTFALSYRPNGATLLAALLGSSQRPDHAGGLFVWRPDGRPVGRPFTRLPITALAVGGDGKMAAATDDLWVFLSYPSSARPKPPFRVPATIRCMAFAPRAEQPTLVLGQGKAVELRRAADGELLLKCSGHKGLVQTLAFAPDGRTFLSGAADGTVRRWDTVSGRQLAAWQWEVGPVNAVAVAPDGQTAACGGDKSAVVVWDLDA